MRRPRDESKWLPTHHKNVDEFLSSIPSSGAHAISLGGQHLDLLIEDRRSPVTLVVFHSALSPREETLPVFQGMGSAEFAGINLLALADPSLEMGDIDLAWFLGNRFIGSLRPRLLPVVNHVLKHLGSTRTILMGGSGGGFAAILFALDYPGCLVLALNPRLDLTAPPFAKVDQYLRVCHMATGPTSRERLRRTHVPDRLVDEIGSQGNFHLLIWQNLGDTEYMTHQLGPFLAEVHPDMSVHVRYGDYGEGHKPVPGPEVREAIRLLAEHPDDLEAIRNAGFVHRQSVG